MATQVDRCLDGLLERMKTCSEGRPSIVVQDFAAEEGRLGLPYWASEAMRKLGVQYFLPTAFGVGDEVLGFVVASRNGQPRPWTAPEGGAVESITADLGRGLHHARLYESENRLVEDLMRPADVAKVISEGGQVEVARRLDGARVTVRLPLLATDGRDED